MSDFCGCDDGETPTVYEATDVRMAAKLHKCSECRRAILPGESYWHVFGIWPTIDGPDTIRTCARCMVLREWLLAHVPCACLMHGNLIVGVQDEIEYCPEPEVLRPEFEALVADIRAQPSFNEFAQNSNMEKP